MSDVEVTKATAHQTNDKGAPRATTGETVTLGCKMPNGLVLQLYQDEEVMEPLYGGGYRAVKIARPVGEAITLNGCAINVGNVSRGIMPEHLMIGGFGLTSGVPREFWERWLAANKDTKLVKNRVVFEAKNDSAASSKARELASGKVRSGLEPLDPENLPKGLFGRRRLTGGFTSEVQRANTRSDDS